MTSKDESIFTKERILSIAGTKIACIKCLSMVIAKLAEESDLAQFVNKGFYHLLFAFNCHLSLLIHLLSRSRLSFRINFYQTHQSLPSTTIFLSQIIVLNHFLLSFLRFYLHSYVRMSYHVKAYLTLS